VIVDDEETIRNGLFHYNWESLGFSAIGTFPDGESALAFLLDHQVDVILCDIKMPRMNGLALAQQIQERKIPSLVVFLTGYKDMDYIHSAMHYGSYDYLLKPTKFKQLEQVFGAIKQKLEKKWEEDLVEESCFDHRTDDFLMQSAFQYINNHLATASLEVVSSFLHLTPHYFSSLFKAKTGQLFSDYCQHMRMEKAQELLKNPRNKFQNIAVQVGYSVPTNCARAFKKEYGLSPTLYRSHLHHTKES
jgi:YesN/AraC family two-component response regulator